MVEKYDYHKPRRINTVSVTLFLMLGIAVYLGYCFFPVLSLNADVKTELDNALTGVYQNNLAPEPMGTMEIAKIRNFLLEKLRGITKDPKLDVTIKRDKKKVSIDVGYVTKFKFEGSDKQRLIHMHPHVETSAARIEW